MTIDGGTMDTGMRLVITDGTLLRCKMVDNSYVPTEMLDICDVITEIMDRTSENFMRRLFVPPNRRCSAPSPLAKGLMPQSSSASPANHATRHLPARCITPPMADGICVLKSPQLKRRSRMNTLEKIKQKVIRDAAAAARKRLTEAESGGGGGGEDKHRTSVTNQFAQQCVYGADTDSDSSIRTLPPRPDSADYTQTERTRMSKTHSRNKSMDSYLWDLPEPSSPYRYLTEQLALDDVTLSPAASAANMSKRRRCSSRQSTLSLCASVTAEDEGTRFDPSYCSTMSIDSNIDDSNVVGNGNHVTNTMRCLLAPIGGGGGSDMDTDSPRSDIEQQDSSKHIECSIRCLESVLADYQHVAVFTSGRSLERFIRACVDKVKCVAVEVLDIDEKTQVITVLYQKLTDFKQEFMMLNLNQECAFFLKPF